MHTRGFAHMHAHAHACTARRVPALTPNPGRDETPPPPPLCPLRVRLRLGLRACSPFLYTEHGGPAAPVPPPGGGCDGPVCPAPPRVTAHMMEGVAAAAAAQRWGLGGGAEVGVAGLGR